MNSARNEIVSGMDPIDAINAATDSGVLVRDGRELSEYISKYPQVGRAVIEVIPPLARAFSADSQVSLEFFRSQSEADSYPVFFIRQSNYQPDIMARIGDFLGRHEEHFSFSSGWLGVTTDFRPPR